MQLTLSNSAVRRCRCVSMGAAAPLCACPAAATSLPVPAPALLPSAGARRKPYSDSENVPPALARLPWSRMAATSANTSSSYANRR
jgi:hypothetical protein